MERVFISAKLGYSYAYFTGFVLCWIDFIKNSKDGELSIKVELQLDDCSKGKF
jgi:hypothetical protein